MRKNKEQTPELHQKRTFAETLKDQVGYYLMILPAVVCFLIFSYGPMIGIYMAFTDYKPVKGVFGSKWIGLTHFKKFFTSLDFTRVFRNTLMYNILRIALVNILAGVIFALLLYEIRTRVANKIYQTCMLLPAFLSWTVISAALLIFLNPDSGIVNNFLKSVGLQPISWYRESKYWPAIILLCYIIKDAGMASIYFYAALLSIDMEQFDAAQLDGANRLQQIWNISIPAMSKVLCITLITQLGSVLTTGMAPFYELTFNQPQLYETTEVLGIYIYNGLGGGRYSFMTAVGLVQSLIGLILVLTSNGIVKRIDSDSAMF